GSPYEWVRILNKASRSLSLVGRTESDFGPAMGRERSLPPTTRTILVSMGAARPNGRGGACFCHGHSSALRFCRALPVHVFRVGFLDAAAVKAVAVHRRPTEHRNRHWTRQRSAHPILCVARRFRSL